MFEGTLIESRGLVVSGTKRWTALGSAALQLGVAGLLVAFPLMHPDILPIHRDAPQLVVPQPMKPPVVVRVEAVDHTASAMSVPSAPASAAPVANVRALFVRPVGVDVGPEPVIGPGVHMGDETSVGSLIGIGPSGPGPNVTVARAKSTGPVNVSTGVSAGLLLAPIVPMYPAIAKAAGVQGAVVMEAVISKTGRIESLHAVSGPSMLRRAALDAVQAARYKPYRLNGEATEVQTTITVVFRLGS
jgi:periplasmic protein TonB